MEDAKLITALKAGDQNAYRQLVRLYHKQVYRTCLGIVHDAVEAEDTTQEVFVEVYRSVNRFREDAKVSTWMYRIAVNKSLDVVRGRKRGKRAGAVISLDGEASERISSDHTFVHPGAALEQKEEAKLLYAAIDCLPEKQKAAFTLSRIEGLNQREVAEAMEMNEGGVESLLQRAKQNLKKILADYYLNH